MALNDEIKRHRSEIRSDGYPMSIGELISLYEDRELDIQPHFQRFFRWSESQKSRLIESLLLGIPIPSIFVSQRSDGVWDVIDGQQRLSTIFEFVGVLRDANDRLKPPLTGIRTRYLPSLEGKTWSSPNGSGIGRDNQLLIKRSKIDLKIILRESSEESKYELFQRLNTGGSQLSQQEMRNVITIMVDPSFFDWMVMLSQDDHFRQCTALSDKALEEKYDLELVIRFLALGALDKEGLKIGDLGDFLDRESEKLARDENYDRQQEADVFRDTFEFLDENYGDTIFRRFDLLQKRHLGGFLISAYEAFAIGLSWHVRRGLVGRFSRKGLESVVKEVWKSQEFLNRTGSGIRASQRIPAVIPFVRDHIEKCLSATNSS